MFTMMNYERLGVGIQGLATGERSYQSAIEYARERIQSRAPTGPVAKDKAADPIIVHPDVRRMLLQIPRIGQEVIVSFLEGDPDRPIITGRVYNAEQTVPYELPANATQSGTKSRSSKGGTPANFNEIRMEDKKGAEQLPTFKPSSDQREAHSTAFKLAVKHLDEASFRIPFGTEPLRRTTCRSASPPLGENP